LMVIGGKNTLSAVKVASNGVKLEPEMLNGAVPGLLICKGWGKHAVWLLLRQTAPDR
jgi:hypothetical protein